MQWIKRAARLLAGASMSAACVAAVAADVPVVFDVGSLHVERHGGRGSPIVVIPGLASGSWVWQDVVAALQTEHRVYAVTLAGFDGRPRVAGDGVALATRQLRYMQRVGVISAEKAAALAVLTARSDPAATADYAARIMTLDLRPQLRSIHVPVMELSPFYASDYAATGIDEARKTAYYRSLLAGIENLEVVSIPEARHFAMIDQPQAVLHALTRFLRSTAAP